jgi:hypothetical protein
MKMPIDWIIENSNECDYVDFKKEVSINFNENEKNDFIMDMIAFANSSSNDEKYIIFGVEINKFKEKILHGIKPETLLDGASYQQLIEENVEPRITFESCIFEYNGKKFGVIKIYNCDDKPYFAKKDRSTTDHKKDIRKGEFWLRISDHKVKCGKAEHEIIMESIKSRQEFDEGKVKIVFQKSQSTTLDVECIEEYEKPSEIARKEILANLDKKRKEKEEYQKFPYLWTTKSILSDMYHPYYSKRFDEMNEYELEEALKKVDTEYEFDDLYELFEVRGEKLQLLIFNDENTFIDEATIRLSFPNVEGMQISLEEYEKPDHLALGLVGLNGILKERETSRNMLKMIQDSPIVIEGRMDKIRHGIEEQAFIIPLRVVFYNILIGKTIEITLSIVAKNLKRQIVRKLKITVVSRASIDKS